MRRRSSLRWRVTLTAAGLIAAVLVVGALALAGLLRRALESDTQTLLLEQVDEVATLAGNGELPDVLQAKGREIGQIQVRDANDEIIASTKGIGQTTRLDIIQAPAQPGVAQSTVSGAVIDSDASERYRVVARTVATPAGSIRIYGVSSLRAADNAVRTLALALLAGVPLLVGVAAWVLWRSVGRALAPVEAMRAEVDEIEAASLQRRLAAPPNDDELGRLAGTLNHLLDRLDADAQRQRQFAADASHELRSPLAAARAQLEVGLAYPQQTDWPATAGDVLIEVDRLERLSRELLDFARTDMTPEPSRFEPLDLAELVDRTIASTPPGHVAISRSVATQRLAVSGDDDLLTRLVRNLLNNAQRHARSSISVSTGHDGTTAWLRVANDGDAIGAADRERIFEPFTRLDAARAADSGGTGLGLAISRRIARLHRGELTTEARRDGAAFVLTVPLRKDGSTRIR